VLRVLVRFPGEGGGHNVEGDGSNHWADVARMRWLFPQFDAAAAAIGKPSRSQVGLNSNTKFPLAREGVEFICSYK